MAQKPPLKELFEPHEMLGFVEELKREATIGSERATILVASSQIDEFLRRRLFKIMVDKEAGAALLADTATAPLGSFSARIQAGIALGVLIPAEGQCLNAIRGIRNIYAHRLDHEIDKESVTRKLNALCDKVEATYLGPLRRDTGLQRVFASAVLALMISINRRHMANLEQDKEIEDAAV